MIKEAIKFVMDTVIEPDYSDVRVRNNKSLRTSIVRSRSLIQNAKKIGDLYLYIKNATKNDGMYNQFRDLGLPTFEDILDEFEKRFSLYLNDHLTFSDFRIGELYTSFDICYISRTYDVQKGIYLVGDTENLKAIFIKATLDGKGKYQNKWIKENELLKYYLESRKDVFKIEYKNNQAIINSNGKPIYTFIKKESGKFLFSGIYKYIKYTSESDGSKWFTLANITESNHELLVKNEYLQDNLDQKVKKSLKENSVERKKRLKQSNPIPKKV